MTEVIDRLPARKKRRGPPPLDSAQLRVQRVTVKFNRAELQELDARRSHFARPHWLRIAALSREAARPVPELNQEAWRELARALSNLNQFTKHLNQLAAIEGAGEAARHLGTQLNEVNTLAIALRSALVNTMPAD